MKQSTNKREGERLSFAIKAHEGERLSFAMEPEFAIVTARQDAMSNLSPASLETLRRIRAQRVIVGDLHAPAPKGVKVYGETEQLFADWLHDNGIAAAIVRPDRYVFGGARTAEELNALVLQLGQRLCLGA